MTEAFEHIMRIPEQAQVRYAAAWSGRCHSDLVDEYLLTLNGALAADVARGATTVGPHRDDLQFTLGGHAAESYASQGQLRAMVLAWKVAELDHLEASSGVAPVLLLDDVSSELDPLRNQYLFEYLRRRQNQCFITTTHPRFVLLEGDRRDHQVAAGSISTGPCTGAA
jgi:DNA replication and repair protein RecF